MLSRIIQWSGRNPFLVLLATLFVVLGGIVAVMTNGHTGEVFSLLPEERVGSERLNELAQVAGVVGVGAVAPVVDLHALVAQGVGLVGLPEVGKQALAQVDDPGALVARGVG